MGLFAKNLRFLRKQRNSNQGEIAGLFKKKANTIGNWENGKSEPNIGELIMLADYFNIGLQRLLHADLQKEALGTMEPAIAKIVQEIPLVNAYPPNESATTPAQEGSQDTFWLILRELRLINEKLEELKLIRESGLHKPGSDKSYH